MSLGLAFDTTFDDTSVALLRGRREILANLVLSQFKAHAEFGGVVPERASRKHLEVIFVLLRRALAEAGVSLKELDWVAVSNEPGLIGAIMVGVNVARTLSYLLDIPLIGINHIEAHPYASVLAHGELPLPVVHLVVAGGHTLLIHQRDHFDWEIVGRSVDDAAGECLDKVARLFGHPMPGGPIIDRAALEHAPGDFGFPRPMLSKPGLDFSFSGLKTAMAHFRQANPEDIAQGPVLSALFESIADVLVGKTLRAARQLGVSTITVSGGVAASGYLRQRFEAAAKEEGLNLLYPPRQLCTDNAAMVACLASYRFERGLVDDLGLEGFSSLRV